MTTTATALTVDLGILSDIVDGLNDDVADIESCTVEEAVTALKALQERMTVLKMLEAGIERWIAQCFTAEGWRDPHELAGLGMVEVRRSTTRREWDHESLRRDWLNAYVALTGGEVTDPAEVRDALLDCVSVAGWKVTGLKKLGIVANDYCHSEPGTPRVVIA